MTESFFLILAGFIIGYVIGYVIWYVVGLHPSPPANPYKYEKEPTWIWVHKKPFVYKNPYKSSKEEEECK